MKSRETCGDPCTVAVSLVPYGRAWQRFAAEVGAVPGGRLLATIVALILFNFLVHGYNTGRSRR